MVGRKKVKKKVKDWTYPKGYCPWCGKKFERIPSKPHNCKERRFEREIFSK